MFTVDTNSPDPGQQGYFQYSAVNQLPCSLLTPTRLVQGNMDTFSTLLLANPMFIEAWISYHIDIGGRAIFRSMLFSWIFITKTVINHVWTTHLHSNVHVYQLSYQPINMRHLVSTSDRQFPFNHKQLLTLELGLKYSFMSAYLHIYMSHNQPLKASIFCSIYFHC